jgi:hypothetical protein
MKVEDKELIIDSAMSDEDIQSLQDILTQNEIDKIVVENEDISAGIIQVLWCSKKEIATKSLFLKKIFENVGVMED